MKRLTKIISVICLFLVCSVAFLSACSDKLRNPDDLIGVYNLSQMRVSYKDGVGSDTYAVDYENNVNDEIKELSKFVYEEYNKYQYAVKKNADRYVFEMRIADGSTGKYVTSEAVTVEIVDGAADYVLKGGDGAYWEAFNINGSDIYYEGEKIYSSTSDAGRNDLKGFMAEHGIVNVYLQYKLAK